MNVRATLNRLWRRQSSPPSHVSPPFQDSASYWERRYSGGGDSGAGSYGRLATQKAEVVNGFVREHGVASVIEFGCGDGNQLSLAVYPRYLGLDVSDTIVRRCCDLFREDRSKEFRAAQEYQGETAELGLSLDVIYHLVETDVFEAYMRRLFDASTRFVLLYTTDFERFDPSTPHVRHRCVSDWVAGRLDEWSLVKRLPNRYPESSMAEFLIYSRHPAPSRR